MHNFDFSDFENFLRQHSKGTWNGYGVPPEFFEKETASQRQQAQYEAEMRARAKKEYFCSGFDPASDQSQSAYQSQFFKESVETREKADYRQTGLICKMASEQGWKVQERRVSSSHVNSRFLPYEFEFVFYNPNPKQVNVVGPTEPNRKEALKSAALRLQPYLQ